MEGDEAINFVTGTKRVERKKILAKRIWDAIIHGYIEFPDDRKEKLDVDTWLSLMRWLYNRVDGSPSQAMDITSGDEPLQGGGMVIILPSNGRELEEDQASTGAADAIPE